MSLPTPPALATEKPLRPSGSDRGGAGGAADDQLGLEEQLLGVADRGLHLVDQQRHGGLAHRLDGLADRGQRRVGAVQPAESS